MLQCCWWIFPFLLGVFIFIWWRRQFTYSYYGFFLVIFLDIKQCTLNLWKMIKYKDKLFIEMERVMDFFFVCCFVWLVFCFVKLKLNLLYFVLYKCYLVVCILQILTQIYEFDLKNQMKFDEKKFAQKKEICLREELEKKTQMKKRRTRI